MGKKIIKVPANFEHPKDSEGFFIPGAHLELLSPLPTGILTHYQIYETVSEGTPVSPIFTSQQALDEWLAAELGKDVRFPRLLTGRAVPGVQAVKGREFMYIESAVGESFHQLVNSAFDGNSIARPKAGGAGEEKVRITLKDGSSLMGISFKGDIDGWRAGFIGLCAASGRRYGSIREDRLFLSDGSSPLLEELEITFEK